MSAAPTANQADGNAPKKGSKKLILIIVGLVVVLLLAGVGAFLLMQKNMSHQEGDGEDGTEPVAQVAETKAKPKVDPGAPPIFVPLEPFIVNLADRESERFAQIGINLQVDDAKVGEQMKLYMPAIRNAILLILSRKTAEDLLTAEGKVQLAGEIQRGAARAMGYEIEEPEPEPVASSEEDGTDEAAPAPKKRKKKKTEDYNPILQVHYANFIIQ
ncbi:MAG: flagellar basal body-associated FliL family protein [Aquabacterium sp.]|jgi:flagellar FliL protein|uniref:flagellar basal body-associated FliL family protein n=1 Tax=Aquabacterium sp. TaxID=1872578 RepID=UPI002A36D372|nr:flagellar basal body-associated FliL family protein [Aquabacterium sp.]MDX9845269.1 flagellar basal body-associated FliL family protein [Aquabacterium sp.]